MPAPLNLEEIRKSLGDRYAIERELGRGGMGAVYLARDVRLDRQVALKVLPPELAGDSSIRERFLRETRTAASFSHPNIVPVHEVVERDGTLAFAMGYVEGESLAARVNRAGPLDVRGIVRMLQDVGYALAYAHGRGVVHRDIKPDNIMLDRASGRALLMDFGISRTIAANPTGATQGLTRVGEVVGTPEYMSPEQATGDQVDGRTDIYSLGLVALYAMSGSRPVTGTSSQQILMKQLTELPAAAASLRPDLPPALAAAVDRCVLKQASERFQTAEALIEVLDNAQLSAPEIPPPVRQFAQEAGTLGLIFFFLAICAWLIGNSMAREDNSYVDISLPVVMLFAVGLTRTLEVFGSARRLASFGFPAGEVLRGLKGVLGERDALREQLRADPEIRRRRRLVIVFAALQLALAVLFVRWALMGRYKVGPRQYHVGTFGTTLFLSALAMFGVSVVLLLRSPLRRSGGERLFRLVWLGLPGRLFLRLAGTGVSVAGSGASRPAMTPAPSTIAPAAREASSPAPSLDKLAALEARLAALEKERETRP